MRRIFVDTGAWYALIDRKDPEHFGHDRQIDMVFHFIMNLLIKLHVVWPCPGYSVGS